MSFRRKFNAALRKNKGLFHQHSTQNFSYATQAKFLNNFDVTYQLHVELEWIQKFKQNAIKNMHYSVFNTLLCIYWLLQWKPLKAFSSKKTEMSPNKSFLIFKYSILTFAAPSNFARLGTALNYLPLMA